MTLACARKAAMMLVRGDAGMSAFEFAFSLFGLLLGLSVAEVMAGFARVLRARAHVRLGWLTPLVGTMVMVDLVTFWANAWDLRDAIPPSFGALLFGTAVAAVYYLSASLVFPDPVTDWADLDDYFMRHKWQMLAGIMAANLLVTAAQLIRFGNIFTTPMRVAVPVAFTSLGVTLIVSRSRRVCAVALLAVLSLYAVFRLI